MAYINESEKRYQENKKKKAENSKETNNYVNVSEQRYKTNQISTLLGNPTSEEEFNKAYNNMTYVISSSMQDYVNQYNSLFDTNTYKTEWEAKNFADQLKVKASGLKNLFSTYGVLFNDDYVSEVIDFLNNADQSIDKGVENWSQFKTKNDYDSALRFKGYSTKYQGMSADEQIKEYNDLNSKYRETGDKLIGEELSYLNQYGLEDVRIIGREYEYKNAVNRYAEVTKRLNEITGSTTAPDNASAPQVSYQNPEDMEEFTNLTQEREYLEAFLNRYNRGDKVTDDLYNEYKYVLDSPDFAELSKAGESKMVGNRYSPEFDATYNFINDIDGFKLRTSAQKFRAGSGDDPYSGYNYMTEREIGIYNYLYATEGKESANKYLVKLNPALEVRSKEANDEYQQHLIEESALYAIFANASSVITKPFGEMAAFVDNTMNQALGNEINPYSDWQTLRNTNNAIRQATTKVIEENTDAEFLGENVWGMVYNAGMSTADSLYGVATFGKFYTLVAGSGAATNKAAELYEKGASGDQIFWGGLTAGLAEYVFEKVSIDNLIKLKNPDSMLQTVFEVLKQAGIEGSEEVLTEIANTISDGIIMGSQSDLSLAVKAYQDEGLSYEAALKKAWQDKASDIAWAGISGMMSGGASGSITSVPQSIKNAYTGSKINKQDNADAMILAGIDASQNSQAYGLSERSFRDYTEGSALYRFAEKVAGADSKITKVAAKIAGGKGHVSNMRLGALKQTTTEDVVDQYRNRETLSESEIQEKLESRGIDSKEAAKFASMVAKLSRREKLSEREIETLNNNVAAKDVAEEVISAENVNKFTTISQLAKIDSLGKEKVEETPDTYEVSEAEGKTLIKDSGAEVKIEDIASMEDGKMMLKVNDGTETKVVNAENISFASNDEAILYETVAKMDIDAASAKAIIGNFDAKSGISAGRYILGAQEAFRYGKYNFSPKEMSKIGFSADLTQAQKDFAYNLGKVAHENNVKTQDTAVEKAIKGTNKNKKIQNDKKGKVHFEGEETALTDRQKESKKALEVVAKALGINIYLYETTLDDKGRRVYIDKDGKEITAHGWYDKKTGDIHIDINAGNDGEGVMLFTAAHELTHFIRQWSPAKFKVLADFLMAEYGKEGVPVAELVRAQMDLARRQDRKMSYDAAYEEMIADSMQTMLSDGAVVEKLAKLAKQDKTLVEKMADYISKLVTKIKEAYAEMTPYAKEGRYAAILKEGERLQELFYDALVSAGENYRGAGGKMNTANTEMMQSARDSEGNVLTEAQQEYFEASVVRDALGRLIVVYHGTEKGGFTVFDPKYSDDKISLFFSDDLDLANSYSGSTKQIKLPPSRKEGFARRLEPTHKGNKKGIYKVYLNLTNPYILDGKGRHWDELYDFYNEFNTVTRDVKFAYDKNTYKLTAKAVVDGKTVTKTFDLSKAKIDTQKTAFAEALAVREYAQPLIESFYKDLGIGKAAKVGNERVKMLITDIIAHPDRYKENATENVYDHTVTVNADTGEVMGKITTRMVGEWAKANGYDGVIFKDIIDVGGQGSNRAYEPRNVYIAFNAEQVKSVDNKAPTSDPDIRYSARFDQHSVETALWDAMSHKDEGYDNLILVSTMPDYIVDKLGIEGDFYIYRDHAYENMVSKEEAEEAGRPTKRGKENIHFHNFGIEKMTRAILSINNPIMTISTKTKDGNPAVIMLLDEYGANKAPLYAVLSFYANKGINGDWSQRPHIVLTIAERNYTEKGGGRAGYDEVIKNAIKDGRVLDFDEKKRDDLSVIANTAGIGNITKSSLDKNITYFKKEVKAFKEKNNILYSERNPDSVSNRSLLANALENAAQNDIEKNKLQQYKEKIDFINAEERKLADLNRQLKELRFSKGKRDAAKTKKINDLQAEATKTANRISIYDKQLLTLEASKPLKNILEREKAKAVKRQKQRDAEILQEQKNKANDTIREIMTRHTESRKKAVENRHKSEVRNKIKSFKEKLQGMLLHPTDRRYVPAGLAQAMIDVCEIIDTDTSLYKADGSLNKAQAKRDETKEKLQALKDEYEKLRNFEDSVYSGEFDDAIYSMLTTIKENYEGKSLKEMSVEELDDFYNTLRSIELTLADARKLIGKADAKDVYEAGYAIISEQNAVASKRKKDKRSGITKAKDSLIDLSLSPVRNVERMSGYKDGSMLVELFNDFEVGVRNKNKFVMEAYKDFEAITTGKNAKNYESAIYNAFGDREYTDSKGRKFKVSKMQMMQAILSKDRESTNKMTHIENGGLNFADLKMLQKGKLKEAISAENSHLLPRATEVVEQFRQDLANDTWAQEYMQVARRFFDGKAKEAVNNTMLALKHRIVAKDKNYIPFEVDRNFIVREISAANDIQQTINSYGMLQETKAKAPQPLIITGLNNIIDRHIDQVGNIEGLAIPVRNFNKVWNVHSVEGEPTTVNNIIEQNWGSEGKAFVEQVVQDLQGARKNNMPNWYRTIKSNYIGATFLLNGSVVSKQIGSMFAARSMLDTKPNRVNVAMLGNLLNTMIHYKQIAAEVDKYTASAWMRRQGMSDAEVYTLLTEGRKSKIVKAFNKLPAALNPSKWITAMDSAVALSLWKYAKQDVANKTGLEGEALNKATADFYDTLIENTQSMTDVLHRPEIQKKNDLSGDIFGMFKTDLYQMAGNLQNAMGKFGANKTKENAKALGKSVYAILSSAMWGQLMTTIFALLRYKVKPYEDDEEDELTIESWLKRQGFALAGDLTGYVIPLFGSEVIGVVENIVYGETEDIADSLALTAVNDLYSTVVNVASDLKDGEEISAETYKKFAIKALQVFGIPANNILRTVDAIRLHAEDIANGEFLSFKAGKKKSKVESLYDAIVSGDEDELEDVKGEYKTEDAYEQAIRKGLRENDPRIREAAQARIDGDISEYSSIVREIKAEGHFLQDTIVAAVNAEINLINKESKEQDTGSNDEIEDTDEEKATSIYRASDINAAFENGDTNMALTIIEDLVKTKVSNGMTEKEAKSSVKSSLTSYWKPLFLEAYNSKDSAEQKRIRQILVKSGLYGRTSEVIDTTQQWIKDSRKKK